MHTLKEHFFLFTFFSGVKRGKDYPFAAACQSNLTGPDVPIIRDKHAHKECAMADKNIQKKYLDIVLGREYFFGGWMIRTIWRLFFDQNNNSKKNKNNEEKRNKNEHEVAGLFPQKNHYL